MANRLDLIKFTLLGGKSANAFGLQEVDKKGTLIRLFDHEANQFDRLPKAKFEFIRTLGEINDAEDFWNLVTSVKEITLVKS